MKKLSYFVFAIVMSFASIVSAQETAAPAGPDAAAQPQIYFQGSAGLNMCMGDCDNIDMSFGVNLAGFYKVMPNIYVGGVFEYYDFGIENGSLNTMKFGAEGRYEMPVAPKITAYGLGGLGYTLGSVDIDTAYGSGSDDDTAITITLGGGANYSIAPNMSVGAVLKYNYNMWSDWSDNDSDFHNLYIGLAFNYAM